MKKKLKAPKHATASKKTPSSKAGTSSAGNPSKWIRTDRPFVLPPHVRTAVQKLDDAGHITYIVGGPVRDFLLGRETKDHDLATSASPDEICRLFPNAITVGKAYGVIKVPVPSVGRTAYPLEIATFRQDLEYKDHRHPRGVVFAGPAEDAARRDFTINGLFYDPKTSRILDTVGGMADLKSGTLRAIGNPMERFQEDALRLLRAIRFTTTLGFKLDSATQSAIKSRARLITRVSAERVSAEMTAMLTGPRPSLALQLLMDLGLLIHVLPEAELLRSAQFDLWDHTLRVVALLAQQSPKRSMELAWASLLHETGKAVLVRKTGDKKALNGFELESAKIAKVVGQRLRFSGDELSSLVQLIEDHPKFKDVFKMREATLQRFVREPHFEELLTLHKAVALATDGNLAFYEFCHSRWREAQEEAGQDDPKLISGEDLIQLGMKPGPKFSKILKSIEDLALERKLRTKEEALEYVIKHFVS